MSLLSDDQKAVMRAVQARTLNRTAAIDRDDALVAPAEPCALWPAAQAPRLLGPIDGVGAPRLAGVALFADASDVRIGDTLTIDGRTYHITGLGRWTTMIAAALDGEPL